MAATRIPDTHTTIFTQIPTSIEKTWTPRPASVSSSHTVEMPSSRHGESLLASIRLEVNFNSEATKSLEILDEASDIDGGLIQIWQETRRDWAALESAIHAVVESLNTRATERAKEAKLSTVDYMNKTRTAYRVYKPQNTSSRSLNTFNDITKESDERTTLTNRHRQVETIVPDDSVSQINMTELTKAIRSLAASKSKGHNSNARKAQSILKTFTS